MLPLQQAYEVRESILEYIRATYRFKDAEVDKAFYDFIEDPRHGMIKGPYISLKTPFVSADSNTSIPLDIRPGFPPYQHQLEAFNRLTTRDGHKPENTLLTTGTGSGKTECFQFPVLDYCWRNRLFPGIKAIILYPMNALATDQAGRLAKAIYDDPRLNGQITVGLFIGRGKEATSLATTMDRTHVIEDTDRILKNPPDILLTNFKMLDYGLMRSRYQPLWCNNKGEKNTLLKYLVLDELHTYDGAKGTDVANLIRRLKLKLHLPKGHLCCIGTSATMGNGDDVKTSLCQFATDVYGEPFTTDSIITEHRLGVDEFLDRPIDDPTAVDAQGLASQPITRDLLHITSEEGVIHIDDLIKKLAARNTEFGQLSETGGKDSPRFKRLQSLLAMVSRAKVRIGGRERPYLPIQVQLWIRELSGIRRIVSMKPKFVWRLEKYDGVAMPAWFCRECGASGWVMVKNENEDSFHKDSEEASRDFMRDNKNVYLVNTNTEANPHTQTDDYSGMVFNKLYLNPETFAEREKDKQKEGDLCLIACRAEEKGKNGAKLLKKECPECGATGDSLSIIGTKAATLASLSISQILSSDFDPSPQRDHKVLAFANVVQDAAHESAFFEARNYRFTFRASIQKVINQAQRNMSLKALEEAFVSYWQQQEDEESYVKRFFPPDCEGRLNKDTDYHTSKGRFEKAFMKEFNLRLTSEVWAEMTLNATIGRTLEKTGTSATYFKREDMEAVWEALQPYMRDNNLTGVPHDEMLRFVEGLLHRMRIRGGVDHEYLSGFRKELSSYMLNWSQSKAHILARHYGPRSRFPKVVSLHPVANNMTDSVEARGNARSWFISYYELSLPSSAITDHQFIVDFYAEVFRVMTQLGITIEVQTKWGPNYAISPDHIMVSSNVRHLRCSQCQSLLCVAEEDAYAQDMHCLFNACKGSYSIPEKLELNYYHNVYTRNQAPRIYAHEHTGMLEREEREQVENDFKNRPKPDSINTLVATSTLEMGIDIGSLNTVVNTEMPPLVSNFLQRVGRAGRDSGTALIVDFARNKPHDLFYFEEPLEMMKGEVLTPGCFLSAKDILRRHFLAYCIDCWTGEDPENNRIPPIIRYMGMGADFLTKPEFFLNRLFAYIDSHLQTLEDDFKSQYDDEVYQNAVKPLYETLGADGSFEQQIRLVFQNLQLQLDNIRAKVKDIDDYEKAQRIAKSDPRYAELEGQKRSLCNQRSKILKQLVLEFMTDEGLLPNYAFPEKGVTFEGSVRYQTKGGNGDGSFYSENIEQVRPASSAIKELAPGNYYYTGKYRMKIDGVDTYDWSLQNSSLVRKRFCSKCDYIEDETNGHSPVCPKCGDASFGSDSNVHDFVRLATAKSDMLRAKALSGDSKDERDEAKYRMSTHFIFDSKASTVSYGMKNIPFGIEFAKNVKLVEANLGLADQHSSASININGMTRVPMAGFVTCRYCGKSVPNPELIAHMEDQSKAIKEWHYPFCKYRDISYGAKGSGEVFKEVYFYRELQTEAIKVLLPVQEIDTDATVAMFKAGLELGLKDYFKGNPSHIKMQEYREYNEATGKMDQYIIMYDTIPGGTGYLAKLFDTKEFSMVLRRAYERIRECKCQYEGKDGCYHCILNYGNQYTRSQLSRSKAEHLFEKIVAETDDWKQVKGSLGTMVGDGGLEESELEDRFVSCLKKAADNHGWSFEDLHDNGMRYYRVSTVSDNEKRQWMVYPQRALGEEDGVRYNTRPDFYLVCTQWTVTDAEKETTKDSSTIPHIALYLDGYQYHGCQIDGKVRFYHDVEQRKALRASTKKNIISWTLTWDDLDIWCQEQTDKQQDSLMIPGGKYNTSISQLQEMYDQTNIWNGVSNNMERLLVVMVRMKDMDNLEPTVAHYLMQWNGNLQTAVHNMSSINTFLNHFNLHASGNLEIPVEELEGQDIDHYLSTDAMLQTTHVGVNIALIEDNNTSDDEAVPEVIYNVITDPGEDDLDKDRWNYFWRLFNLLNLGDNAVMKKAQMTDSAAENASDNEQDERRRQEILQYYAALGVEEIAGYLLEHHVAINPEGGFSLTDDDTMVSADAALGSKAYRFVVDPFDEASKTAFENAGYKVFTADDLDAVRSIVGVAAFLPPK